MRSYCLWALVNRLVANEMRKCFVDDGLEGVLWEGKLSEAKDL